MNLLALSLLFFSQFSVVFLLGFQSQTVRDNKHLQAAITSSLIGASQLLQWKVMPKANALEMFVWWTAGPAAIVLSMYFYTWLRRKVDNSKKS